MPEQNEGGGPSASRNLNEILKAATSGYGREQLLLRALYLACEEVLKQTRLMERDTGETVDGLVRDYLILAEGDLATGGTDERA